jgi:hypothetical protein
MDTPLLAEHAQRLAASGMPSVPPGYRSHYEERLPSIVLGRKLSLDNPADVQYLRQAAYAIPELSQALDEHLGGYLSLFQEPHWRLVYDGPTVVFPMGQKRQGMYQLVLLLDVVKWYKSVSAFVGAAEILDQLRNPAQIPSTFFEIEVAALCASCAVTRDISFFPKVDCGNGRITRPDFLWKTTLGDLYCECKRSSDLEDQFQERADRLSAFVEDQLCPIPSSDHRWDFVVARTGGSEQSIRKLVQTALANPNAAVPWIDGNVSLTINPRASAPPDGGGPMIRKSTVPASTRPVPLGPRGATYTLTVKAISYWQRVAMRLIRDARRQLPEAPGIVMISLPRASAAQAATEKIQSVIGQPAYVNTPWIGIWAQGGLTAVHRNGSVGGALTEALTPHQ